MTKKTLACFDFDGTITFSDSLLPFIVFSFGWGRTLAGMSLETPAFIRFILGSIGRQETKERILKRFFGNMPYETFCNLGCEFALKKIPSLTKKEALSAIEYHKKEGHRLILISASLETYLLPWANYIGFDDVIASKLFIDRDGRVTGMLQGKNCRAEEKVKRLRELVGPLENYTIIAYGDSKGDKELLAAANHSFYRNFKR